MGKKGKEICRVCGTKQTMEDTFIWNTSEGLYPKFAMEKDAIRKLAEDVVECPACGYTFINLSEQTYITKKWVRESNYRMPFGENVSVTYEAVKCYRTAMVFERIGCRKMAAAWYLYAGICVEDEKQREKCLRQTLVLLQKEVKEYSCDFEICLAYLNVLRMLGVYESTISIGTPYKVLFHGLERELVTAVLRLCDKKDKAYYTYFEMLLMKDEEEVS